MSHASNTWARRIDNKIFEQQDDASRSFKPALLKWLLVEIADCEQGSTGLVWPSIALLAEKTLIDRKAVQIYLQELVRRGLIADTGERKGRTHQIPVYRLVGFDADAAFAKRQFEERQNRNDPAQGVVSDSGVATQVTPSQVTDSTQENAADFDDATASDETIPRKGSLGSEATPPKGTIPPKGPVPSSTANDPLQPSKRPLARGTERVLNGSIEPSDAHTPARAGARVRGAESEPDPKRLTAEQVFGHWRAVLRNEIASSLWLDLHEFRRLPLDRMPTELQQIAADPLALLVDRFAKQELREGMRSRAMIDDATRAAQDEANAIAATYRRAVAA